MLAVDVSAWLRPDAATSPDRLFCHVYGRGRNKDQLIPGWPYSFAAALEPGRTSWTQVLDAVRLGRDDDVAEVTAVQVRAVVQRLITAGQWLPGDPEVLVCSMPGTTWPGWRSCSRTCRWRCWADCARTGCSGYRPRRARPRRSAGQARRRVLLRRSRHVVGSGHVHVHVHRDQPLRRRLRDGVGSAASAADPPCSLVGVRG
jgi:hypothetical protein